MNKQDIIQHYTKFIKEHNLHPSDFTIGAGGACVMFGLRETTNDMDMDIERSFFNQLAGSGKYEITFFGATEVLEYDEFIDLHVSSGCLTVMVDGVCCWSPEEVLAQKQSMNREKDQADIQALLDYIGASF